MTAQSLPARNDERVPCPHCGYSAEPGSSIAGHVAMAHPEGFHTHVLTAATPAVDDQCWLDDRIARIEDGLDAVLDIAAQWTDGRNLARLHPGTSAQDYVLAHVKHPLGRGVVLPLLAESNWSNRQIAAVAGVSDETVNRAARATNVAPREVLGADGKTYPPRVVQAVVIDTPSAPRPAEERSESEPFCRMTSKSTGQGCQQPERWLMRPPAPAPMEVCQQHGKMLERQGWQFVRELHPVPGFERAPEVKA